MLLWRLVEELWWMVELERARLFGCGMDDGEKEVVEVGRAGDCCCCWEAVENGVRL